ncbi:hypothetical protein BDB01DRAFT_810477 [Pilobolus umbonatus]|nr:hypothetical protein BDB01DRAFT_810477 [Pilobolus umbonatus]
MTRDVHYSNSQTALYSEETGRVVVMTESTQELDSMDTHMEESHYSIEEAIGEFTDKSTGKISFASLFGSYYRDTPRKVIRRPLTEVLSSKENTKKKLVMPDKRPPGLQRTLTMLTEATDTDDEIPDKRSRHKRSTTDKINQVNIKKKELLKRILNSKLQKRPLDLNEGKKEFIHIYSVCRYTMVRSVFRLL